MKGKMIALSALITLISCLDFGNEPPLPQLRPLTAAEMQLIRAVDRVWLKMFQTTDEADPETNVFISPLSISMALGMTLNGAAGETLDSMKAALTIADMSEEEINKAAKSLIALLRSADPAVRFHIANSIWHRSTFKAEQPFLDANKTWYDSRVEGIDFESPSAPGTINTWVNQNTEGKIRRIIDRIPPEMVMYLINAIYFKGDWTIPFDPAMTRESGFTLKNGTVVQRTMMTRKDPHRYFQNKTVQAVELPYGGGLFSVVILLPAEGTDVSELLQRMDPTAWNQVLTGLDSVTLALSIPKFRFSYDLDLKGPLRTLGMGIAFDKTKADFRRINESVYKAGQRLYISEAKHKTFVEVNEQGTEAAAVTSIGIGVTSLPPSMTVNRPFVFVIRERTSGAVLFAGRILDPVLE